MHFRLKIRDFQLSLIIEFPRCHEGYMRPSVPLLWVAPGVPECLNMGGTQRVKTMDSFAELTRVSADFTTYVSVYERKVKFHASCSEPL